MPTTLPDTLSIREAGKYLRIPLRSMYKLAQEGKIPCEKMGWQWEFRKEVLDRWLESFLAHPENVNVDVNKEL